MLLFAGSLGGCAIEEGPRPDDPQEDGFRADGCGAYRHKEKQDHTCKYEGYLPYELRDSSVANAKGACTVGDANHIQCTYNPYTNECRWKGTQTAGTCVSDGPGNPGLCTTPPAMTFNKTYTLELPSGNMLCDPAAAKAQLDDWCWTHKPATLVADLTAVCTGHNQTLEHNEVECCVDDDDDDVGSSDGGETWSDPSWSSSEPGEDSWGGETWDDPSWSSSEPGEDSIEPGEDSSGPMHDEVPDDVPVPFDVGW
jgi:hypothetical protein